MTRSPPRLPRPFACQRSLRTPPPPLIRAPSSGRSANDTCNARYGSSSRCRRRASVKTGVSMKRIIECMPMAYLRQAFRLRGTSSPSSIIQRRDPANAPDDQHRPSSMKPGPASHDPDVRTENSGDSERHRATLEQGPPLGLIHDVHVLVDTVIELKAPAQSGDDQVTRRIVHLGGSPAQFSDQACGFGGAPAGEEPESAGRTRPAFESFRLLIRTRAIGRS